MNRFQLWLWDIAVHIDLFLREKSYRLYLLFCNRFRICCYCFRKRSIWWYGPGLQEACDDCVPRGCSCNHEPISCDYEDPDGWYELLDEKGRKYPCCEWMMYTDEVLKRRNEEDDKLWADWRMEEGRRDTRSKYKKLYNNRRRYIYKRTYR